MAWETSTRRQRLPRNWKSLRTSVLIRDRRLCQVLSDDTGFICGQPATEVDHITAGDDHSLSNLQAICTWHHRRKSSAEGNAAKVKWESRYRRPESHPGSL
jgi:5-methylcytosine-specific restriction endonuclease McrA